MREGRRGGVAAGEGDVNRGEGEGGEAKRGGVEVGQGDEREEERRVGKECRSR